MPAPQNRANALTEAPRGSIEGRNATRCSRLLGALHQITPAVTSIAAPAPTVHVAIAAELRARAICAVPVSLQTL